MGRKYDPKKIKALAIDLDGTMLLPDGILGERTKACLKKLVSRGMQIIISTGRSVEASEKYYSAIGAEGPMVFFNGAVVADVSLGKILHLDLVSMEVMDFGADLAHELGVYYQVYLPPEISPDNEKKESGQSKEALFSNKYGTEADEYFKHTGITPVKKDLKSIAMLPVKGCIKGMFIADSSVHEEIRQRLHERFGSRINVFRSSPIFLEVTNSGASKGEALKIAMHHRGITQEEIIAFGDEENDLPMFTVAGFAAVPKSARKKIQEAADLTFGSHIEEGLAEYLEKVFL